MAKKQKKQPPKSKSVLSNKKYILFFVILVGILFLTLFQVLHKQTYQQQAATATCGAPGDKGNAMGVGKYCTQGGGQCQGTGASICSADIQLNGSGICSKACNTDADCGTGAVCFQDTLGKGCEPVACQTPSQAPSSGVPSSGCLAAGGCPSQAVSQGPSPSGSTQPSHAPTTPSGTPTNNGGGGNIFQLLVQFFLQIIQFFMNLFKGL